MNRRDCLKGMAGAVGLSLWPSAMVLAQHVKIMPNDGDLIDLIPLYAPDPVQQRKLLVDNPVRLFGFQS